MAERGGHLKLAGDNGGVRRVVVVPPAVGGEALAIGTLKAVLWQAGLERDDVREQMGVGDRGWG